MKVLNLIIKKVWFDQILSGEKKVEHREIRAKNASRYVEYFDKKGNVYAKFPDVSAEEEEGIDCRPVHYDAIRFFVGYNKDRDSALVEVKGAEIFFLKDESGKEIVYEYEGKEYLAAQIDFTLGSVIEKHIH